MQAKTCTHLNRVVPVLVQTVLRIKYSNKTHLHCASKPSLGGAFEAELSGCFLYLTGDKSE